MGLSVVVPSYNSAPWLRSTLEALAVAIAASQWDAEVIVVDDGSTDRTEAVISEVSGLPFAVRVITQQNAGRFLARWNGVSAAAHDLVLLLDSRVLVHGSSLDYVWRATEGRADGSAWNAHVVTDPDAPLVGRFWDVPVAVFWGTYLRRPRPTIITAENFDRVPKGTTAFLVPKQLYLDAARRQWPEGDLRLSSDDTKLIRDIVAHAVVRLDPGFAVTYRPRVTAGSFLRHTRDRGSLFVDSYAGTSILRNVVLVLLGVVPLLLVAAFITLLLVGLPLIAWGVLSAVVVAVALPAPLALGNGATGRSVAAYFLYLVPFALSFWLGLVRGILLHRKSFRRIHERATTGQ